MSSNPTSSIYKIQLRALSTRLIEQIESLSKGELAKSAQFRSTVALLSVLTWCEDKEEEEAIKSDTKRSATGDGSRSHGEQKKRKRKSGPSDPLFLSHHRRIARVFQSITRSQSKLTNVSRPILRTPHPSEFELESDEQLLNSGSDCKKDAVMNSSLHIKMENEKKECKNEVAVDQRLESGLGDDTPQSSTISHGATAMEQDDCQQLQEAIMHMDFTAEENKACESKDEIECRKNFLWRLAKNVFAEIPIQYSMNVTSALLYLLLTDATTSFLPISDASSQTSVPRFTEIPCLLEMIKNSSNNNTGKLDALLGEYLALVRICLFEEFSEFKLYQTTTKEHDFSLRKDKSMSPINVSVKSVCFQEFDTVTCFENPQKFERKKTVTFASGKKDITILLHNCPCEFYHRNPIRKVQVELDSQGTKSYTGLLCTECTNATVTCNALLKTFFDASNLNYGVVYLASAKLFYELRYSLCSFVQKTFRQSRFKLRDLLSDYLRQHCTSQSRSPWTECDKQDYWMPTVIDRTEIAERIFT